MASQPVPTEAETVLVRACGVVLRERANDLLRSSVIAGNADLWGNTIHHAMVDAALALHADAALIEAVV